MSTMTPQRYGWRPDLPDHRDLSFPIHLFDLLKLPQSVDLRPGCPNVYDQGQLGSCTANAVAAAYEFDQIKQGLPSFMPSRLFIYYNERLLEHTVSQDSGATIRESAKVVRNPGVCHEDLWPYDISRFALLPPYQCYLEAKQHHSLVYQRIQQDVLHMKACLASGYGFIFGFTVYSSFESAQVATTGIVPMPGPDESVLGGHAVMAVGYRDDQQVFIVRNSWGSSWGDAGYCYMPYSYLSNHGLASDFWTIRTVA